MNRVYISYASADRAFAKHIGEELESSGYKIVSGDFEFGDNLEASISAQMSGADIVILIHSQAASESKYVLLEFKSAFSYENKIVVPILLDTSKVPAEFMTRLFLKASSKEPSDVLVNIHRTLAEFAILKSRDRTLLISTIVSFVATLVGALVSIGLSDIGKSTLPVLGKIHWTVWVCLLPALYGVSCYINDRISTGKRKLESVLTVPYWTQLRGFGDKRIARISYVAIAIIPVIAYFVSENPANIELFSSLEIPLGFRLTFFASWFFSIALMLFVAGCPKEFRKILPLESAKTVNLVLHESPGANVKIDTPKEIEDTALDSQALELRAACFLFYLLGISVAAIIFARAAWFVTKA